MVAKADSNDGVLQRTCNRGSKRIDLILGDAFIRGAVIKSGPLEENDGFFSDHTMQWVDLNTKNLFKSEIVVPIALNTREFVVTKAKKKHAFQDKFDNLNAYHKVEAKIDKLEADFKSLSENELDGDKGKRLVARYQTIDRVIADNMKCAENSVKSSDRGY